MEIAVTAEFPSLDSPVDPRFGRCPYFILIDPETLAFEAIPNPFIDRQGGAGIQAGKLMAERCISAVLTGRCGPNAEEILTAAGIRIVPDCAGSVREAVERFRSQQASSGAAAAAVADKPSPQAPPVSGPVVPKGSLGRGRGGGGRGPCGMGMGRGMGFRHRGGR